MINAIVKEIYEALDQGLDMVALMSALALPDICGKAEYPELKPKERYIKWFDTFVGDYERDQEDIRTNMPYPSGEIIFDLRCALLHEGNPTVNKEKQNLVSFKLLKTKDMMHGGASSVDSNGENRTLEIAIYNLCWKICRLSEWHYNNNKDKYKFNYIVENWGK